MGQVSTVTIGVNTYSVYALTSDPVADANEYFAARLGSSAWTEDAEANDKKSALVSAVRFIDRAVIWSGTKTVVSQPLEWPRDSAACNGTAVDDGTTPDDFATAEFEQALILLQDATAQDSAGTGSNIKAVTAGSAKVEFFTGTVGTSGDTRLPVVVNDLVGCYIASLGSLGGSFGTSDADGDAGYCKDDFDLTRGLP